MTIQNYYGTGRRKSAVAKVFMQKGEGVFTVNNTSLDNYFKRGNALIARIHQPLIILELLNTFNVIITVKGGGERGQADAIRLGISRALLKYDEFNSNDKGYKIVLDGKELIFTELMNFSKSILSCALFWSIIIKPDFTTVIIYFDLNWKNLLLS